ncbi:MAG: hypothetical protein IT584_02530 [Chlamydiae bacterium]|nr:hypothetical protein [Chlamydiota bacterium]
MAVANNFLVHANLLTNELGYGDLQWQLLEDSQAKSKLYPTMEEAALVAKRISDFYYLADKARDMES